MFQECEWLLVSMPSFLWRSLGTLTILTIISSFSIVNGYITGAEEVSLETETTASCEPGWMLNGESCYRLTTSELTWIDAQNDCDSMNSPLAEVESSREQNALNDFLNSTGLPHLVAWIGLYYRLDINRWTWGSGRSMNYSNWDLNEPNNEGGNEYCVNVGNSNFSRWNVYNCTKTFYGVCQRALCERGWMLKGESCFKLTTSKFTWSGAQENCRSMNGLLAEVQDRRQQLALYDFIKLKASSINELWIGLRDQQNDRYWTWGSGRSMNYSYWFPTEPNNSEGNERCVSIWPQAASTWNDNNCTLTLLGVCQKGYCDGGWTSIRKSCYLLFYATTRAAAQAQCSSMNGSLVEINNSHEQEELYDFLQPQEVFHAWIGLSDAGKNRQWKWDSGSNLTYQNWKPGEPNNKKGEEFCVAVLESYFYQWDDDVCDQELAAVCKQNKAAAAYSTRPALDADVNVSHTSDAAASSTMPPLENVSQTSALCEPGWMLKGESCYKLTTVRLTWSQAQESCRSVNGLLAEVQDDRELLALNDFINLTVSSINELWIGLSDQQKDRNWTWGSGRSVNYSNWFPNEPSNSGGDERCVSVWPWSGSRWNDNMCTQAFLGVCQKGYCGGGWTSTRKSCYQLTIATARAAAQAQCNSMSGSLIEINNYHEQEELQDFLKSQDAFVAWIGLSDAGKHGNWKWDSGSNLTYQYWIPGVPSNDKTKLCVTVLRFNDSKWSTGVCDSNYPAVCKQHKGALNCCNQESPSSELSTSDVHLTALCEPEWMLKGESCYKLTTEELTWSEAQENCRSMNGLLAEVQDNLELLALNDFINLKASSTNELWIGLSDQQNDRNWTWGSGTPMNYSNWFPTEPNNGEGNERCVSVWPWSGSRWNDNNCTQTFLGVCQKGSCGGGWTSTRKSCYLLTNATTRAAAQAQCNSVNGSLVEINNSNEQEELHDFLKSQDASVAWIGLSDAGKNRKWKWDSGSNLTYQYWNPGEPNNEKDEEYCVSVWQPNNYEWNDCACDSNYAAACKQHKGTVNCCHQESPSSEYNTSDVHLTGGTLAAVACSAVGASVIVGISIYLWQRKPWKKHPAGHVCDARLATTTLANENKCIPLQEHYLNECSNSSRHMHNGLGERPPTNSPIDEEEYYEEIIDHTHNTYCHLDVQPRSPPNIYDILL